MKREGEIFLTDQVQQVRAAVIGDMMADRYVFGSVNRISPEAPVPVNLVQTERAVLGGAWKTKDLRKRCAGWMGCMRRGWTASSFPITEKALLRRSWRRK